MKQNNILQFLPYYPPHKWGLETHAQQWALRWKKQWYGEVFNIITHFGQPSLLAPLPEGGGNQWIEFEWKKIWYIQGRVHNLVIPSIEIITNFPVYKFWTPEYRRALRYIKKQQVDRVITRTRFFFTSFIWWLYAKKNKIPWCHVEHGSDYVKLSSKLNSFIAFLYDRTLWFLVFLFADRLVWVSDACRLFIQEKFVKKEVWVIHRWVELHDKPYEKKEWDVRIVFVWRLVKLKWVEDLLVSVKDISRNIEVDIIWDGDEKTYLEKLALESWKKVNFLWFQNRDFILDHLYNNKCICVNTSYQEWLPTSVIEWLYTWNVVVASNVGWTKEISDNKDLLLFEAWNKKQLLAQLKEAYNNYDNYVGGSYNSVREKFSWERNIKKYKELFYG